MTLNGETFFRGEISRGRLAIFLLGCTAFLILVPIVLIALQVSQDAVFILDFVVAMLFTLRLWPWSRTTRTS